jgi:regulatory protein
LAAASLRARAIGLLARREYARSELQQKLLAKGGDADEVRVLLDELIALGYLSDARYAQVAVAHKSKSFGRRHIAESLRAKGIARADIETALTEAGHDDDAALRALWQRRFGHAPVDAREEARQVRFLQARGFAVAAIVRLIRASRSDAAR